MTADETMSGRFASTPVADAGTPESEWQHWFDGRGRWPGVDLPVERLIVLSAHPDDEVLGVGALISSAARRGIEVVTVCLSDGAASHPGSPTLTPEQLAALRRTELDTATSLLGLRPSRWCGLADGTLAEHEEEIEVIVTEVLAENPTASTGLMAVWAHDGHPDHEAVGRCAQRVGDRLGVPLWMYPIWMWHWASPDDPDIPWQRAQTFDLDDEALDRKRAAVDAFVTQISPLSEAPEDAVVLGPHILARLLRDREFVFA
ncbi:PIG-L deacetylase family protein [Gordonia westfalica]|uniref:N-acetylglucosaminyl deacetylase, LmbE family n=1 Tax=Gordonia westfalica TaxID=158898 RepID=A0A1H2KRQ0_9ACTN|nr:PIG-L deacetylase family protein [Gordonia westfalica]SDU71283.1 N-acetylglucosaminyl deacetylase, LmbE family [Gordonia westfalica]